MLFLLTFFLIFGWKINSWFDISAMLGLALVIFMFAKESYRKQIRLILPTASLIALLLYSTTIVLLTGMTDLQPILRAGRALVILLAGYSLFLIYKSKYENPINIITKHIFYSLAVHSLIMITMYCSDIFLYFIYSLTDVFSIVNISGQVSEGFRICGLTYSLSQTSVLQLFGLILLPYIYFNPYYSTSTTNTPTINQNNKHLFLILLSSMPLLISIIISGRSGLFIGFIYLIFYIIYKLYKINFSLDYISKNKSNILKYAFIAVLTIEIIINILPHKFVDYSLFYAKEIFQVFVNKSTTIDNLKGMYFLPDNITTTIFGCGNYGRTKSFYLLSDVGYIKSIFAIGIIGTIFMVIPFLWGIITALKNRNKLSLTIILIFLASLILNFKELALLTRNQWTIQAIFLAILNFNTSFSQSQTKKETESPL